MTETALKDSTKIVIFNTFLNVYILYIAECCKIPFVNWGPMFNDIKVIFFFTLFQGQSDFINFKQMKLLTDWNQILCVASIAQGNQSLLQLLRSHGIDGHHDQIR